MSESKISVIIPTYNRRAILKKTINAYTHQSADNQILEILVVDDGSTDGTRELVSEFAATSDVPVRYLHQENSGLAAARNHGLREARGELVLLTDDDIIPTPGATAGHAAWHRKYPDLKTGVVGNLQYSPEVHPTPFQQWWGQSGVRYRPPCLFPGQSVALWNMQFGYTSLKLEFVKELGLFDERFRSFGHEDNEFAYRLVKSGGKVLFNPDALAYHYKRVTFSEACRAMEKSATSGRYLATTEAGTKFVEVNEARLQCKRERIKAAIARSVVPILAPLKPLLDSQIPLPGKLYGVFYRYHVDSKWESLKTAKARQ